ncbi:LytTR family DNA-binding domain-containing protein (plasmid) [Fibrella sp. ES10-3-2-2]
MAQSSKPAPELVVPGYRSLQDADLILYCQGDVNYTRLYLTKLERPLLVNATTLLPTRHSAPLVATRTLKYFDEQLPGFIRISKSLLVNPRYIDKIRAVKSKSMQVHLLDGTILRGSRRRILETLDKFTRYRAGVAARPGKPA